MENTKGKYWTKIAIMAAIPAILVGIIYVSTLQPTIDLLNNKDFVFYRQIDSADGGNSECKLQKSIDGVDMIFTLGSSFAYPYVGIEIHSADYSTFSVEGYAVEAEIETNESMRLSVRLQEAFDFGSKGIAYPVAVYSFLATEGESHISLPVTEVKDIPEWWFALYPQWNQHVEEMKYKNISTIWLTVDNSNEKDKQHKIRVKSLRLVSIAGNECLANAIKVMFAFWTILGVVTLYLRRVSERKEETPTEEKQQQVVYIPYEKLDTDKDTVDVKREILTFIGKNYPNPELKLADIAKALSMTEDKTSEEIRVATGKTFKAYLNTIRIEESKRLLKETTMQISEIAFSVGYNNVQHFNRVFKESVGVAPGAFRDGATGGEESPEGKA